MHPRSHVRRCRSRSSFRHILQLFVALFTILQCLFQAVEAQHAIGEGFTRMVEYSQVISPPRSTPVWPVSGEVVAQQASESRESIDATASIVSGTVTQLGSSEAIVPTEPSSTEWTRFDKVVVAHAVVGSIAWMIVSLL